MIETGLLVVDVQPAYNDYCAHVVKGVARRINNTCRATLIMWVGAGITSDSEEDVRDYLHGHGARPGRLDACRFVEKDYGFFRSWMDYGVARDHIIRVGKELLRRGLASSELLPDEVLYADEPSGQSGHSRNICAPHPIPHWDPLTVPSFNDRYLRLFDAFETCGGGALECLAEVELWLEMIGTRYRRIDSLIY